VAARFAGALRTDDGSELASVSEEFERMGDMVAAVDAASHAALVSEYVGVDEDSCPVSTALRGQTRCRPGADNFPQQRSLSQL
jgi:hypothetical protein